MGCRKTPPLLFQSKLLCLSLLYLCTTLPLSLYVSFSQSGCIFRSPLSHHNRNHPRPPLFSYPPSYGEHKYAIPTFHSSCTSSVPFPDYSAAFQEIRDICRNSSSSSYDMTSSVLRYMPGEGRSDSFAGNFSTKKRKSFFDHSDGRMEVPCGFLREFPVKESDRLAMANCHGVVVASAVFGDHDKIRQPKGLGLDSLRAVCFFMLIDDSTLRGLRSLNILTEKGIESKQIGVWRIVKLPTSEMPYKNPAMNGVIPKHLIHRLFPNSKFSIWLDAKIQLTVDPLLLIHSLLITKDADMAVSKHPFNVHTMEEAMATARWKKWGDVESLRLQMETYCENGLQPWSSSKLPYTTDVPDTALILRKHGLVTNLFSCLLFNELEAFNPRDQLAFAYVRDLMTPKLKLNLFDSQVFEQITVEYRHNLKRGGALPTSTTSSIDDPPPLALMASAREINGSSCEGYLRTMWSESND